MENRRDDEAAPNHQVTELPADLLSQLLSRLPVLDLVRYRLVSTGFNSSILDPNCVRSHLRRSPKNQNLAAIRTNGGGLIVTCYERRILPHPSMIEKAPLRFAVDHTLVPLTSCNGVLCLINKVGGAKQMYKLRSRKIPHAQYKKMIHRPTKPRKARLIVNAPGVINDEDQGYRLRFLNPATKMISQPSPLLRFNVGHHSTSIGFGYDIVNHLHKVVVVLLRNNANSYAYTMETRQWNYIGDFPASLVHSNDTSVEFLKDNVYVDGTLNWIATNSSRNQLFIISLNLTTNVYNQKNLPQGIQVQDIPNLHKIHIGVVSEKLSFSYYSDTNHYVVWILQDFTMEGSWAILANINLEPLPMPVNVHQSPLMRFYPLNMLEETGVLILLVRTDRYHLIFYNCGENAVVALQEFEFEEENAVLRWMDDASYMESLVRPL